MKLTLPGVVLAFACCAPSGQTAEFKTFDEAVFICAGPAKAGLEFKKEADWEYTKWGMTPKQVVAASKNQAKENADLRPDSDGNVTKLTAPFKSGKFVFEAQFGFDAADKLASVTLVLNDKFADMEMDMGADMPMSGDRGICHDLGMAVNAAFGQPSYQGEGHLYAIEKWRDEKNKYNVDYHKLYQVGCYVQYSVIKPDGAL